MRASGFPSELRVRTNEAMSRHTSLGVGGPADFWVEVRSQVKLVQALEAAHRLRIPRVVVGHGTNILVADEGIEGLVICNRCRGLRLDPENGRVCVESGYTMTRLARQTAEAGLAGLAFGIGVPGTVGGAVYGNAGAFGSDMAAVLQAARVWYPDAVRRIGAERLDLAYRESALKHDPRQPVVLEAQLGVRRGDPAALKAELLSFARRRWDTQPRGLNAGSFFKNPPGEHAGRLIEAAGLKGASRGGAQVSTVHANFITNPGGATAAQVLTLARHVQATVQARFGVRLEPEVRLLGRWSDRVEGLCA